MNPNSKSTLTSEQFHRERRRKSLNSVRVFNPTDEDYQLNDDGFIHVIPASHKDIGFGAGQRVIQYHLARKFAQEIKDKLINEMADREIQNIKERLIKQGATDIDYNANYEQQRTTKYRTDNPELIRKIYKEVWLGTEQEYGLEQIGEEAPFKPEKRQPVEDSILAEFDKPYVPPTPEEVAPPATGGKK